MSSYESFGGIHSLIKYEIYFERILPFLDLNFKKEEFLNTEKQGLILLDLLKDSGRCVSFEPEELYESDTEFDFEGYFFSKPRFKNGNGRVP